MTAPLNTSPLLQVDNSATDTISLDAGFTFTAGRDAIFTFAHYADNNDAITSVTIGGTAATLIKRQASGTSNFIEEWAVTNMAGGTANIVLSSGVAGGHYISGAVTEWTGGLLQLDAGTPNGASGTSAAPAASTAISTSTAASIISAACSPVTGISDNGLSGPTGYTVLFTEQNSLDHQAGRAAWKEESTTGTKAATFGMTSGPWIAIISAYKIIGGGGGGLPKAVVAAYQNMLSGE